MQKFKKRWEISKNWQLIHPFLGILAALFSGYFLGKRIIGLFPDLEGYIVIILLGILSVSLGYLFICISLWCFKKLENKWLVNYRGEFIAIFLCFAVTGSSAGRLSDPIMSLLGLYKETTPGLIYWPIRILIIFPVYQVLLVLFGWVFGQYTFFKAFASKMISHIGLGFLISKYK